MSNAIESNVDNSQTGKMSKYTDFKLNLIEKTYELYIQRMDIWEQHFYQIKYGCITLVVLLLWFRYTNKSGEVLNYIALVATLSFWVFESTLRVTSSRYMAKMDILGEIINDKTYMEKAFENDNLNAIRILEFDTRIKRLKDPISEYIGVVLENEPNEEKQNRINEVYTQKKKLISFWKSFKVKGAFNFYLCIIILQIITLILYK